MSFLSWLSPCQLSHVLLFCTSCDVEQLSLVDCRASVLYKKLVQRQASSKGGSSLRVLADPDTLLARLNTRRLRQRLKYLRQQEGKEQEAYAIGKTTKEIATKEWQQLLKQENALPSDYELLLFSPCPRAVTILASYPRSGNSLLRNLFERVTLRVTGSDMRGGLTQHDLVGEAAVQANRVQLVKTHFPERRGVCVLPASRVVLLVRNPLDAINSYFHLLTTRSHTTSLTQEQKDATKNLFDTMVRKEIVVWKRFHEFWISQVAKQTNIPILLVRYEDLIRHTEQVVARVVKFVLEIDDMTFFRQRVQQCCAPQMGIETIGAYKPRVGGIGKSLAQYTQELRKDLFNTPNIQPLMHQLGYAELLDTNSEPAAWKLPHIPEFAFGMNSGKSKGRQGHKQPVIAINKGPIVRSPQLSTNWNAVREAIYGTNKKGETTTSSEEESRLRYG